MNWLTKRLVDIGSYRVFRSSESLGERGGRIRLPASEVFEAVGLELAPGVGWVREVGFLVLETAKLAQNRIGGLPETEFELSDDLDFVLSLADSYDEADPNGLVISLPDDLDPVQAVEVFSGHPGEVTTRLTLTGVLPDHFGGELVTTAPPRPRHCSDGICRLTTTDDGHGCGGLEDCTCECVQFNTAGRRVAARLSLGGRKAPPVRATGCYCTTHKTR